MAWKEEYKRKLVSAEDAVAVVKSGDRVAIGYGDEPVLLSTMLQARAGEIEGVEILYTGPGQETGWFDPGLSPYFRVKVQNTYRSNFREIIRNNQAEFIPFLFTLSLKALLEREPESGRPDVFMTVVSPPDEKGFCSFGHSLWNKRSYLKWSRTVMAEVDQRQMRTCGDNRVHVSEIDYFVDYTPPEPAPYYTLPEPDDVVRQVGEHVAGLVNHGDTVQIGWSRVTMLLPTIGVFDNKLDLGIHAEVTAPGVPNLVEAGVFNGKRKTLNPRTAVMTALYGAGPDMELAAENPRIQLRDVDYTNDLRVISSHDNMVAINGAVSVDLTGQINVESGRDLYPINGPGGQPEFVVGSLMSKGGRSITVLRSTNQEGTESRIVPVLEEGSAVTIPRTLADYVITEYGVARLLGKSLRERAEELVATAHPQLRGELRKALKRRFYSQP
ncbi:MAG: acetyl-CoA hydrolase/transferase family protein [Dehalococcoidia bacterium]